MKKSKRVVPLEARELAEVRIVGMEYRLVFDCKGGDVSIRHQVRAATGSV